MNNNVKKVFEMLGITIYEEFKLDDGQDILYRVDENLWVYYRVNDCWEKSQITISEFLTEKIEIVKLPKKKKLRDLTNEEYIRWWNKNCGLERDCENCPFYEVLCNWDSRDCWIKHKTVYNDKFLDQEVEIPQEEE